jgi:hypothetical protein
MSESSKISTERERASNWVKRVFKKRDPTFLKVYINGKPHFKLFRVLHVEPILFGISDDTFRIAKALGLRLTKDREWIIQTDEDSLDASFSQFFGRTVTLISRVH